jgi:ribosomal protein S18 acetylase RimI-like enzyme
LARALNDGATVAFDGGRYAVSGTGLDKALAMAEELGLRAERRTATSGGAAVRTRVAIYKPWTASMDEGWTEWLLDSWGFKYTILTNPDIQAGDLNNKYDVILFASDRAGSITDGFAKGSVPPRYEGGLGDVGVRALDAFVRAGGSMVTFSQSSDFAINALHLPVKNVVAGLKRTEYFSSGSILEVNTDASHPVMAGMPEKAKVFVEGSPVFTTTEGFEGSVLARYAKEGSPLMSGYLLGEKYLQGQAAAVDVKHGRGHVVLIGFRPQWRGQPFGTFKVVFNSLFFGGAVAQGAKGTPTAPVSSPTPAGATAKPAGKPPTR